MPLYFTQRGDPAPAPAPPLRIVRRHAQMPPDLLDWVQNEPPVQEIVFAADSHIRLPDKIDLSPYLLISPRLGSPVHSHPMKLANLCRSTDSRSRFESSGFDRRQLIDRARENRPQE